MRHRAVTGNRADTHKNSDTDSTQTHTDALGHTQHGPVWRRQAPLEGTAGASPAPAEEVSAAADGPGSAYGGFWKDLPVFHSSGYWRRSPGAIGHVPTKWRNKAGARPTWLSLLSVLCCSTDTCVHHALSPSSEGPGGGLMLL